MTKRTSNTLLLLLILQNTTVVLVAREVSTNYNYDVKELLLIAESIKFVLSLLLESYTASRAGNKGSLCKSLHQHVLLNPLDALKLSIPALLYVLQNVLNFIAISMIPVPLFLIIQQTKLVKTTFLSIILLKRTYNIVQWISILSLCLGSGLCFFSIMHYGSVNEELKMEEIEEDNNQVRSFLVEFIFGKNLIGIIMVVAANFSSSLAGVYFELVIKGVDKHPEGSKGDKQVEVEMKRIQSNSFDYEDDEENSEDYVKVSVETEKFLPDRSHQSEDDDKDGTHITQSNNFGRKKTLKLPTVNDKIPIIDSEKQKRDECEAIVSNNIREGEERRDQNIIHEESFDQSITVQPSIWMRNIQLGFFTLCIILADYMITSSDDNSDQTSVFGDFNLLVWIQILLFAFGGLVIALVIQHADNVQKGLCMGISVVFTSAISIYMDRTNNGVTLEFVLGSILAIGGCFTFANSTIVDFKMNHFIYFVLLLLIIAFVIIFDFSPRNIFEHFTNAKNYSEL